MGGHETEKPCPPTPTEATSNGVVDEEVVCSLVGWLLNVPAACECISGTDLRRQVYMLPH